MHRIFVLVTGVHLYSAKLRYVPWMQTAQLSATVTTYETSSPFLSPLFFQIIKSNGYKEPRFRIILSRPSSSRSSSKFVAEARSGRAKFLSLSLSLHRWKPNSREREREIGRLEGRGGTRLISNYSGGRLSNRVSDYSIRRT